MPAGGDEPNMETNLKFAQKINFLNAMKEWFISNTPKKAILVGDLNIAPDEDDVWDHNKLLKVVSHTPLEIDKLLEVKKSGDWIDVFRKNKPKENFIRGGPIDQKIGALQIKEEGLIIFG